MTISDIQNIISGGETKTLELKKTTGELKDAMHTACAMLNSDGGFLIFGISPKSLKIVGQNVTDNTRQEIAVALGGLEPAEEIPVEYIELPEHPGNYLIVLRFDGWVWGKRPYTFHGSPYYKVESTTMLMPREMYDERIKASNPQKFAWERQLAEDFTLDDLDFNKIRGCVRLGIERGRIYETAITEPIDSILKKWRLTVNNIPTNGAAALFAKERGFYTQFLLRLARFKGTDKDEFIDNLRVEGNYFDLLDAGMAFFFKHLSQSAKIVGFQRVEHLEVPAEALREALTNALCHRAFEHYNLTPSIAIYDDRIEIANPGRFPAGLTPDNIKDSHESFPYNPVMAEVLFKTGFLEIWGSGMRRMVNACKSQNVPEPTFSQNGAFVIITFRRQGKSKGTSNPSVECCNAVEGPSNVIEGPSKGPSNEQEGPSNSTSKGPSNSTSSDNIQRIVSVMNGEMTFGDMMTALGFSSRNKFAVAYLNPALESGLIEMTQPDSPKSPTQKYRLTEAGERLKNS